MNENTNPPDAPETLSHDTVPTSFGVFKPVGHVMVGLPTPGDVDTLEAALRLAGWEGDKLQRFAPKEAVPELEALVEQAGPLAGFGYEIVLLRRYLALAKEGVRWLLVKVSGSEEAAAVADLARSHHAKLAVHYRMLTIEDLIQEPTA